MIKHVTALFLCVFTLLSAQEVVPTHEKAVIKTSKGDIKVNLFHEKAPKSVANFVNYAQTGFYNDTVFHRVISGFMIQGGGLTQDLQRKKTNAPIANEASNGLKNKRGTLSMARTGEPHSATSQFFINLVDNEFLDYKGEENGQTWGYAVFGEVIGGMDIVDSIAKVATNTQQGRRNVPVEPIKILSVEIIGKLSENTKQQEQNKLSNQTKQSAEKPINKSVDSGTSMTQTSENKTEESATLSSAPAVNTSSD